MYKCARAGRFFPDRLTSTRSALHTSAGPDGAYDKYHSQTKVEVHTLSYGPSFFCLEKAKFCNLQYGSSNEISKIVFVSPGTKRGARFQFKQIFSIERAAE